MAARKKRSRRGQALPPAEADDPFVREPDYPELVIGLVAAVGTPLDLVQQSLSDLLGSLHYSAEVLRLSDYTEGFELESKKRGGGEASRIDAAMNRGNEARRKTGRNDILSLAAIADIRKKRGNDPGPLPRRAFILRQLKRPEEVQLLRRTYGEGFVLLGVYCRRSEREKNLRKQGIGASRVQELIRRDEHETELGGQALRDTFHLADLFIEVGEDPGRAESDLKRTLNLVFGLGISTPTKAEYGMFHAHAASLRSAQLGRQVGAALLSEIGDVISVGANEVPRFGGGLYWENEEPDVRDHKRGRDSSDEAEEEIVCEILERMLPEWKGSAPQEKQRLIHDYGARLRATRVTSLTEFGRAVHAEAEAIVSAARMGVSTRGAELYCTTFPCHVCAKHIVAAGIKTVTYIEPYPKSRALDLHRDAISLEDQDPNKVVFRPFVGVAPKAFVRLFSMIASDGSEMPRKDDLGRPIIDRVNLRLKLPYFSALQREDLAAKALEGLTRKEGD
jgi:deoxycytidylate deaminase